MDTNPGSEIRDEPGGMTPTDEDPETAVPGAPVLEPGTLGDDRSGPLSPRIPSATQPYPPSFPYQPSQPFPPARPFPYLPYSSVPRESVREATTYSVPEHPRSGTVETGAVAAFAEAVRSTWDEVLTANSCLRRQHRNAIRNVLRYFMASAGINVAENAAGYPVQLLNYRVAAETRGFIEMMEFNRGELRSLWEQLPDTASVSTVGRYMLYLVMYLITTGGETVDMDTATVSSYATKVASIFCHKYLNRVSEIHSRYNCGYMFIGLPAYLMQGTGRPAELLSWGGAMLIGKHMKVHHSYLTFLSRNESSSSPIELTLEFLWEKWSFKTSVPEFVLKGLCLRADDRMIKKGTSEVRVYLESVNADSYVYYVLRDTDVMHRGVPVAGIDYTADVSAVMVGEKNEHDDPYSFLSRLITPSECGKALFEDDPDAANDYGAKFKEVEVIESKNEVYMPLEDESPAHKKIRGDLADLSNTSRMIKELETKIKKLIADHMRIGKCCSEVSDNLGRLEKHADTLRNTMLALVRKIDVQTIGTSVPGPKHSFIL
ncbi:P4c precursor [Eastern grey kangaroopox virus]|uniref:P4c n=1 Tax=Eastern grey kangaroopox virus TaxID=2042482 RepID=A0A2C9DT96_9POXV|nr:P4c precursor [Eastern grey kangaroopox virus]ATI21229.1 P4c precursor [Eastern grey kangaroopox virus]ATX75137.1 P4c precursor [Eastern grey kangaroopox virus]